MSKLGKSGKGKRPFWFRACVGATAGGSTRPWSSECVMTSAPMSRVETPQEVAQT